MKIEQVEKAITIVKYAIDNKILLTESCLQHGMYKKFVKDAKYRYSQIESNDTTKRFSELLSDYDKLKSSGLISFKSSDINETHVKVLNNDTISDKQQSRISINGDNLTRNIEWNCYCKERIKTLEQLIEEAKVDKRIWQVKDFSVNKWDTTSITKGVPNIVENFQVKARLEKIQQLEDVHNVVEIFQQLISEFKPKTYNTKVTYDVNIKENNLFEVSIFDLHMGKLAWAGEVHENYDTTIAKERFLYAINKLIKRASGFGFNRILFPIGSDFFNSDNHNNTTTAGTPQDEDLRWQKTFKLGCELIISGINLLKECGVPVDVVVIPGNHDFERSYYMGTVINAWFKDDTQVSVDNHASPRKYYTFDKVLIGLTHGDAEKQDSLPMLMAVEQKEAWGRTNIHEWHCGHLHRKKTFRYKTQSVNEDLGVTIRYLSSLTGTEEWHHKKGFIGSLKAAEGFIWCGESGLVGHLNTNIIIE